MRNLNGVLRVFQYKDILETDSAYLEYFRYLNFEQLNNYGMSQCDKHQSGYENKNLKSCPNFILSKHF